MLNVLVNEEPAATLRVTPTEARSLLYRKFQKRIIHNPALDRKLVSFQANKTTPFYSWFKYKEGFSQRLVSYLLEHLWDQHRPGVLLDPFAGAGAALFAARSHGWLTKGIERLPVGKSAKQVCLVVDRINVSAFGKIVDSLLTVDFADYYDERHAVDHIAITKGAFPKTQEKQLVGFIAYCRAHVKNKDVQALLLYAGFSILEEISYTRK